MKQVMSSLKAEETEEAEGRIENINELLNKVVTYEQEAEGGQVYQNC